MYQSRTVEYTFDIPSTYESMYINPSNDYCVWFENFIEHHLNASFGKDFITTLPDNFVDYFGMKCGGIYEINTETDEYVGKEKFDIDFIGSAIGYTVTYKEIRNPLDVSSIIPDEKFTSLFNVRVGVPLHCTDFYFMLVTMLKNLEQQDSESTHTLLQKPLA